jgi:hypothetical protein
MIRPVKGVKPQCIRNSRKLKPQKPSADFPIFAHAMGHWAKKIQGHWRYFGKWDDPAAALEKYQNEVRSMLANDAPGNAPVARVRR